MVWKNEDEHRLYFVVRSWLMSQIGGAIFLIFILILGSVNAIQAIIIGGFIFALSLVISRFFEYHIERGTIIILKFLNNHEKIKKFVLKYF
jgi:Zn-dependent protease with chaperone function